MAAWRSANGNVKSTSMGYKYPSIINTNDENIHVFFFVHVDLSNVHVGDDVNDVNDHPHLLLID